MSLFNFFDAIEGLRGGGGVFGLAHGGRGWPKGG